MEARRSTSPRSVRLARPYNAWYARRKDRRRGIVEAEWLAHHFDNETRPVDALRVKFTNRGLRPVQLESAGYVWPDGREWERSCSWLT
jgi:hypothetical protein